MVTEIEVLSNVCPECGGSTMSIHERGEIICKYCGLVVNERILDLSHSGIRAFNNYERNKKERTGSPMSILMPDISLSTVIDKTRISNSDLKRAAKWNTHMTWEKRNMLIAITELKRIGTNLGFPMHIKKAAILIYKKVFKRELLRGRSISGMIAACAYYICKKERIPITFQEILDEASMDSNIIKKCYKILLTELKLKSTSMDPVALIPRYCADLNLNIDVEKATSNLLKNYITKNSISGKDPKGLCAGAIYLVAKLKNKKISQKEISRVVKVTEVTLRSRYKDILNTLCFNF